MKKIRSPLNNFQFGEVSPSLGSRTESAVYLNSGSVVRNFNLRPEGGITRRYGLDRLYDYGLTQNTAKTFQSKLVPFVFSDDEKYIVSIENAKVRVFAIDATTGAVSLTSTLTLDVDSVALPFDDAYLQEYSFAQYGDVLFICHQLFIPRMLVRTSLTAFEVQTFSFDARTDSYATYQPYFNFQAANVTLSASATTGAGVTFTTSVDHFDTTGAQTAGDYLSSTHVGAVFRMGESEITITSVQSATSATGTISDTIRHRLLLNPLRTIDGSTTIEVTHIGHGFSGGESITVEDADATGGIAAANINGARTVGSIIDENTYQITAAASATSGADGGGVVKVVTGAATVSWDEQCFSDKRGYPAAVSIHENRLCFAGTPAQPDALWMSKIGGFFNFDVGDGNDDESIQIAGASGAIYQIKHLVSNGDLQVFTADAEFYVPTYLNQAITPTNVQLKKQTVYGATWMLPVPFDGASLFAQKGGGVIREYIFSDSRYTSYSVSTLSAHLVSNPTQAAVVDGAFGASGSYAVFVMDDGTLSVFNSSRAEKRAGWTPYWSDGAFHSVVSIGSRLFANVWFDTGTTASPDLDLMLCEFASVSLLDCSKSYTLSSGIATVSSEFSDGAVVSAIADGTTYVGNLTVSGGAVTVGASYSTAEIGFDVDVQFTPNPVDVKLMFGPETGQPRGIGAVILDLVATRAVKVNTTPITFSTPFTGKKEVYTNGISRDPTFDLTQSESLGIQINGMIVEVVV